LKPGLAPLARDQDQLLRSAADPLGQQPPAPAVVGDEPPAVALGTTSVGAGALVLRQRRLQPREQQVLDVERRPEQLDRGRRGEGATPREP
jgi:hypothetical protein